MLPVALAPQHLGGGEAGRAAADDHDLLRRLRPRLARRGSLRPPASRARRPCRRAARPPARHRVEGRRRTASPVRRLKQAWCHGQPCRRRRAPRRAARRSASGGHDRRIRRRGGRASTAFSPTCPPTIPPSEWRRRDALRQVGRLRAWIARRPWSLQDGRQWSEGSGAPRAAVSAASSSARPPPLGQGGGRHFRARSGLGGDRNERLKRCTRPPDFTRISTVRLARTGIAQGLADVGRGRRPSCRRHRG